jgi:hypothetical protein
MHRRHAPRHKSRTAPDATFAESPLPSHKGPPDHEARMKSFLDPNHPMFRRAWVRWATAIAPLGWAGFELMMGNVFWAILFGAAGGYAAWVLLVKGPDQP